MSDSLSTLRKKRGFRRGQLTKGKRVLDEISAEDLRDQNLDSLISLRIAIEEEITAHEQHQRQMEDLLAEEEDERKEHGEETAFTKEMESGAEFKKLHAGYLKTATTMVTDLGLFQEFQVLDQACSDWSSIVDPTSLNFMEESKSFILKWDDYLTKSKPRSISTLISGCRTQAQTQRAGIRKLQNELKPPSEPRSELPTVIEIKQPEYRTKFDIDLPSFHGKPVDWASYHSLFTTTISNRGKHLSSEERCCLLIKSLKDPSAKELATLHAHGDTGFEKAMSALVHRYGRPSVILPHHIKTLEAPSTFSFSREGLRALGKQYGLTYVALTELDVKLTTYLAAQAASRFDDRLTEEWVKHTTHLKSLPTMEDLMAYIQKLEDLLPSQISSTTPTNRTKSNSSSNSSAKRTTTSTNSKPDRFCSLCPESVHMLARCPVFLDFNVDKRQKLIRDNKWCQNCLNPSHNKQQCTSAYSCRSCGQRHHSLLHKGDSPSTTRSDASQAAQSGTPVSSTFINTTAKQHSVPGKQVNKDEIAPPTHAFLNTALVHVNNGGRHQTARLALDSGSSTSLISESLASSLKLRRYPHRLVLEGAYSGGVSKNYVQTTLRSLHDEQEITLKLSVVAKLPYATPPSRVEDISTDTNVKDLQLADSQFGGSLDILLGNLDVCKCSKGRFRYFPQPDIAVSPTIFGWTVSGPLDSGKSSHFLSIQTSNDNLQESLDQLWKLQQVPESSELTHPERDALTQFTEKSKTLPDGRYSVSLPRNGLPQDLGASRHVALSRLHSNERSLSRKDKLTEFNSCLREYQELSHAELVPSSEIKNSSAYYMPVHGVFKDTSSTTKVRPVFDASSKTSNGRALNDLLLTGPNLYPLLTDILIRFRQHPIGFSADISKMFREIILNSEERDFHRFLMRTEDGNIRDFRMLRLTFGVKASPFLATKVIQDLAEKHSTSHPVASRAILQSFYVDDFLSGAQTVEEAISIREQICDLLLKAGMTLRKWRTSCPAFSATIPDKLLETTPLQMTENPKALGIHWNVQKDQFNVATPTINSSMKTTKRTIASISAQVFDILGLFSPFTITAKIILQRLWMAGSSWDDDNIPPQLTTMWKDWCEQLPMIHDFSIDRRYDNNSSRILHRSLHGFSDASEAAYGAVIYLRQHHDDGKTTLAIVISKARVAPLKSLTIPRAELVAAHLLAKLMIYAAKQLDIPLSATHAWTDSSIVLAWLRKAPSSLQVFVANRVNHIQALLPDTPWKHISTKENPADSLSRGVSATKLTEDNLWWHGPEWLALPPSQWPTTASSTLFKTLPEQRAVTLTVSIAEEFGLWSKYSSFNHLTRIVAWIRRFQMNTRQPQEVRDLESRLTTKEITSARSVILKQAQQQTYPNVSKLMEQGKQLPHNHPLANFNLQLNDEGLITVSGRVRQLGGRLPKQVLALSLKSDLTKLYINTLHRTLLHPGVSALMAILTENHYIPGLKSYLKYVSKSCVRCQKAYSLAAQPPTGLLPSSRTTPSPPFSITGIDFAGPFIIKEGHTRRPVHIKAYLCLFICFSTKAIHLELCPSLSTNDFIGVLKRFCSRRGTPTEIHSDNGTNFVGAAAELKNIQQLLTTSRKEISHWCTASEVKWHFIPPRAPNFGGLWEAGVKQTKRLLKKLVSSYPLKFDELYTVLTEVEAILNSRPITQLDSTEMDGDLVLTPGHFLIGRPLKTLPRLKASTAKVSSLKRWSLVQRLQQDYWIAWQAWYLSTLEARQRKQRPYIALNVGDVVLIKDSSLSTNLDWPLARITALHPGDDGTSRVASLVCQGKHYNRAINRLIPIVKQQQATTPDENN